MSGVIEGYCCQVDTMLKDQALLLLLKCNRKLGTKNRNYYDIGLVNKFHKH